MCEWVSEQFLNGTLAHYRLLNAMIVGSRQPSLSQSVGQRLHAYQTTSVVKAAFLTEAISENWNCKTCVQPSCFNCLQWSAAWLTFCWDIWTIQISDKEKFLWTGFYKLIKWLFPLPRFIFSNNLWSGTKFILVHGQVTITFVVSVGLSVCLFVCLCRVFLNRLWSDYDQPRTYVICLGLVVSPRI